MVVAVRISPPVKGKVPKLNMLELVSVANRISKLVTMVLSLERQESMTDLRRTQRRVAALLLSDTNVELQKYPLRKRVTPQGFCYVCSRIDPSGIFRKPNSYLYRKGFFQTCEHFPKAPYTTFVQEEVAIQDDDGGDSLTELATNQTETISVTIRRGSKSTKFPSPLKREGTFDSCLSKFDKDQRSSRESLIRSKLSDYTADKFSLPSVVREGEGGLSARCLTKTTKKSDSQVIRITPKTGGHTGLSNKSVLQSETLPGRREFETIHTSTADQVTFIPTGFDQTSEISGLSTFTKGTAPSKSTNDLDSKFESEGATLEPSLTSKHSVTTGIVSATKSKSSKASGPITVLSDSYQSLFATESCVHREEHTEQVRRPKGGHHRDRVMSEKHFVPPEEKSVSSYRPESGHFRYHHRMNDDSVPDPGFEIPPTPLEDLLEMEKLRLDQDNILESCSSKGNVTSSISDDASLEFSQKTAKSTRSSNVPFDRRSFCRCATDLREVSFSRNACRVCGKACHVDSSIRRHRELSRTRSQSDSGTRVSSSNQSTSTRQRMLRRDEGRMNIKSKPFTDEDYMDIDSIIHEDDGRYWSSDDEFGVLEHSPVSWYRYKHAQPYPLVNPEIHKLVYVEALQAAKVKGKKKTEDFEIDELTLLRRPNVFSYIPLLPYKERKNTKYIGIRPDNSSKPKNGQFMRHIFGDVRPEDFYAGARPVKHDEDVTNASSTEQSSRRTGDTPAQAVSNDPERSSVSLKMRKQGISFDNDV